jgi:hypothetical protein
MTILSADGIRLSLEVQLRVRKGDDIRPMIADQLGVDVKRVTNQTHFA